MVDEIRRAIKSKNDIYVVVMKGGLWQKQIVSSTLFMSSIYVRKSKLTFLFAKYQEFSIKYVEAVHLPSEERTNHGGALHSKRACLVSNTG